MHREEQQKFQSAVAEQLSMVNRSTFKGGLALRLDLVTTRHDAPQAHTIAKNLLDLLSVRGPGVDWPKRHLLYKDDSQIQALSVICRHGEKEPLIIVEAKPFSAMLDDLELAAHAVREAEMGSDEWWEDDREREWIDSYREHVRNEAENRQRLGDDVYNGYLTMLRFYSQRALLRRSAVTAPMLGSMYGRPRGFLNVVGKEFWSGFVTQSKLRLQIGELPIAKGSSEAFKRMVADEIAAFKERWDWLISPLVIPVALQVIIRPNPSTPTAVLHDLDNIVRDYLIPGIVPSFGTVSDLRWTIDFDDLEKRNPDIAAAWPDPLPPRGTRAGVTRYEAWRLPAVPDEPGFVSVALVADVDGEGDLMSEVDKRIRAWSQHGAHRHWYL